MYAFFFNEFEALLHSHSINRNVLVPRIAQSSTHPLQVPLTNFEKHRVPAQPTG